MAARPIMIQGTMSNAGKSWLCAGLGRIFREDGYSAAPFKSQNMALNSFITEDGLEMGRAQAVQAEACGIAPSVDMNPILLKPTTDMGSQVIVRGVPVGNMEAREYFRKKKSYLPVIRESYDRLAAKHDIIVIEGAGSPAEINLRQDDIVNMGLAELVDAPVLLVGDIDRGGVFAQLLGTVLLLEKEEQERIKGLVINKFRGDPEILRPGLTMLEERVGKPVLGVVPWMNAVIEEEDSLSAQLLEKRVHAPIDAAVIRLPKISNYTDFQMLEAEELVSVRYVSSAQELGNPDLVILPGTKSTIADLLWLRQSGLEGKILRLHGAGVPVFGICGGYQMLGEEISDPEGSEGGGTVRGLGLLPAVTVFEPEKCRTQSRGKTCLSSEPELSGKAVSGYQIHMGRTALREGASCGAFSVLHSDGGEEADGACLSGVFGTYLHGVFDEAEFRGAFVRYLAAKKGIDPEEAGRVSFRDFKEEQFRILAQGLRASLNLPAIYRILGL